MPRQLKKRVALTDNVAGWIAGAVALISVIILDTRGLPQKWHAAVMWTVCAFASVVVFSRKRLSSWQFWVSWTICLAFHVVLMWVLFAQLLRSLVVLGMLYVVPLAFLESLLLFAVLSKPSRK